jgi:hypothetical protein
MKKPGYTAAGVRHLSLKKTPFYGILSSKNLLVKRSNDISCEGRVLTPSKRERRKLTPGISPYDGFYTLDIDMAVSLPGTLSE